MRFPTLTNRILPLLLPMVALAGNTMKMPIGQNAPSVDPAQSWSASLEAETNKNYTEAIADVQTYQQAGGDPLLAGERLGWLNYLNGDYVKAEQYYGEISRAIPTAMNPLLGLLNIAQAQKDTKKIDRAAQSILHNEPSNYRAQMALASMHLTQRDYQRAASEYRRVLMYYPDDLDATSGLAWSVFYLGAKHDALALFRRVASVRPDYNYVQRGIELASAQ